MVLLLYGAFARRMAHSPLPPGIRDRVIGVIESILIEEETHLGVVEQHNALLTAPRQELSAEARSMLDRLVKLSDDDYRFAAELSVSNVVAMVSRYSDGVAYRREIEARAAGAGEKSNA